MKKPPLILIAFLIVTLNSVAQTPDINNSTWSGWTDKGSSTSTGVWASGAQTRDYQIFTAFFI